MARVGGGHDRAEQLRFNWALRRRPVGAVRSDGDPGIAHRAHEIHEERLRILAGEESDVERRGRDGRDHVGLVAPLEARDRDSVAQEGVVGQVGGDRAHGGRVAEGGADVLEPGAPLGVGFDRREIAEVAVHRRRDDERRLKRRDPRHAPDQPVHGVVGCGTRAVARRPSRHELEPERRLLCRANPVVLDAAVLVEPDGPALVDQKLGVPHQLRVVLDKPPGADPLPHLLVRRREEDYVALQRHTDALQHHERHQLGDPFALHVLRAPPPDVAIPDQPPEGIHRPVLGRGEHHVHVIEQDDRAGAAVPTEPGVEVRLAGRRLEYLRRDPLAGQHRRQPIRCAALVAGRVGGVDPQVLRQQLGGFVSQRLPVVVATRRTTESDPLGKLRDWSRGRSGRGRGRAVGAGGESERTAHDEPVTSHGTDSANV